MEIIKSLITPDPGMFEGIDLNNLLLIDIETTGLSSKYNWIYIIGITYYDHSFNKWFIEQLFAENASQEKSILQAFLSYLNEKSVITTYNGDTFDIPFIKTRMDKYGLTMPAVVSYDLLKLLRANSLFMHFPNYKLKTVEQTLGIFREDIYSGKECIEFYKEYSRNGSDIMKQRVLKHNYDDLHSMPRLLRLIEIIENKRTIHIPNSKYPTKMHIESLNIVGEMLTIKGIYSSSYKVPVRSYMHSWSLELKEDNTFTINYELIHAKSKDDLNVDLIYMKSLGIQQDSYMYMGMEIPENYSLVRVGNEFIIENIKTIIGKHLESMLI